VTALRPHMCTIVEVQAATLEFNVPFRSPAYHGTMVIVGQVVIIVILFILF
jgi:hypothetical protein